MENKNLKLNLAFKIIVAGPGGVGKTTLLKRFDSGSYIPAKSTIGVNFIVRQWEFEKTLVLSIWDYAGQERFKAMFPGFCRGASGAIACFDTTNPDTLHTLLHEWVSIIKDKAIPDIPILLVGNKIDKVTKEELDDLTIISKEYAEKQKLIGPFWTSSKSGSGVNELFEFLALRINSDQNKK